CRLSLLSSNCKHTCRPGSLSCCGLCFWLRTLPAPMSNFAAIEALARSPEALGPSMAFPAMSTDGILWCHWNCCDRLTLRRRNRCHRLLLPLAILTRRRRIRLLRYLPVFLVPPLFDLL